MLTTFQLTWVPGLVDDVMTIVSELVTNACLYGGDSFPAGSLTMWHPNTRLIICVHDKNPEQPTRALRRAYTALREQDDLRHAAYVAGRPFEEVSAWSHDFDMETSGRGIRMITRLARNHLGELDYATDGDASHPGKVARVNLLLPNVMWRNRFTDPWTGHSKGPARQSRA
jgi:anti-sigma regulatory factor (Ser/Thr protein kinase)